MADKIQHQRLSPDTGGKFVDMTPEEIASEEAWARVQKSARVKQNGHDCYDHVNAKCNYFFCGVCGERVSL
jgi:hypothetical protein